MKHIFDLDNTLVYTNQANNDAYNSALRQAGLKPIRGVDRITRETVRRVYRHLTGEQIQKIITNKRTLYCVQKTYVNHRLLRYARKQGVENCFVWTSADCGRAFSVMEHHGLHRYFSDIYFSEKRNIVQELEDLTRHFCLEPQDVVIYEDTDTYIEELRQGGVEVVDVKLRRWRVEEIGAAIEQP